MTSDLEACHDRKLPNIGGIVEKSIGANIEEIKLVNKVLLRCKYFFRNSVSSKKRIVMEEIINHYEE